LECAGTVVETGEGVTGLRTGDAVCALLSGGGYAEYALAPAEQVLPAPAGWSAIEAATLPENLFTVYDNLVTRARLHAGDSLLVHGGTSGIGSTAIMLARALAAHPILTTAGTRAKCDAALAFGADYAIEYRSTDFVAEVMQVTKGRGVDAILDIVGGEYVARDLDALAFDGRIVCLATSGGRHVMLDLGKLLARRAGVLGSSLRSRSAAQKGAIRDALLANIWPLLPLRDPIRPVVDSVVPFDEASRAHERMEASEHVGKIVLVP
jgi:putative PIG3 family NAD(P)H quinone oxidoreductase